MNQERLISSPKLVTEGLFMGMKPLHSQSKKKKHKSIRKEISTIQEQISEKLVEKMFEEFNSHNYSGLIDNLKDYFPSITYSTTLYSKADYIRFMEKIKMVTKDSHYYPLLKMGYKKLDEHSYLFYTSAKIKNTLKDGQHVLTIPKTIYFVGKSCFEYRLEYWGKLKEFYRLCSYLNSSGISTAYTEIEQNNKVVKPTPQLYLPFKDEMTSYLLNWAEAGKILDKFSGSLKTSYKTGLLLYGKPGTGKSSTIAYIQKLLGYGFKAIDFSCDLVEQFKEIIPNTVVVMEEIDCIMGKRCNNGKYTMTEECSEKLRTLLTLLDGREIIFKNVVFVATTNYKNSLDEALIRKGGRFDKHYEFKYLDRTGVEFVCKEYGVNPKPFLENYKVPVQPSSLVQFLEEYNMKRLVSRYASYCNKLVKSLEGKEIESPL